jgi:hypothetical protein
MSDYYTGNSGDSFLDNLFGNRTKNTAGLQNGIIWFICFLPLLGLYLENYAVSKWVGIFLWTAVVLLMIVCCVLDYRQVERLNSGDAGLSRLKKWVWLAPVYVFKREKFYMRDTYKSIMLGVFCMAALMLNGFTQGMAVNENSMEDIITNSYVQVLDNFSGSSNNVIGDMLDSYLGEDTEWSCTKSGDEYTAVCSGTHDGKPVEISFVIEHDGFTYLSCRISQIKTDGKVLEGDQYKSALAEIFLNQSDDSSDSSSDSSETEESTVSA